MNEWMNEWMNESGKGKGNTWRHEWTNEWMGNIRWNGGFTEWMNQGEVWTIQERFNE